MADSPKTWVDLAQTCITVGLPIIGTLAGIWLGSILSQKTAKRTALAVAEVDALKHRRDRFWDKRAEHYSDLLVRLAEFEQAVRTVDNGYNGEQANPHAYDASKESKAEHSDFIAKSKELYAAFRRGRIYLSPELVAEFDDMYRAMADAQHEIPPMASSTVRDAVVKAHAAILDIAMQEVLPG